ncbi:hypothetical protein ACSYAD_24355 [Acaryochloris marina NIES-2412]|uniref:hypothetical protein n=1 Tax=Acaryochloris marina TaxID=155978 RepID=UPI00405A1C85
MFTPLFSTAIPLHLDIPSPTQGRPQKLGIIELITLGLLLLGIKVTSNHLANILLNQFISG